jgi:hypothetical protein
MENINTSFRVKIKYNSKEAADNMKKGIKTAFTQLKVGH